MPEDVQDFVTSAVQEGQRVHGEAREQHARKLNPSATKVSAVERGQHIGGAVVQGLDVIVSTMNAQFHPRRRQHQGGEPKSAGDATA
jgi:hypothetical protein